VEGELERLKAMVDNIKESEEVMMDY